MGIFNTILEIIFPSRCFSCGARGVDFCTKCLAECPPAERESDIWIYPLYDYRHPGVKGAVHLLKYRHKKRLAKVFASVIYGRMMEELADLSVLENFSEPILVPLPLSSKRRRERGFNQTELIAKEILELDTNKNLRLENKVLVKIKDTEHQARIPDRKKRLENVVGSFGVKHPERVKNKNIILIDDVTTTGATLKEARKALKHAGARKIIAFTLAH